MDDLLKVLLDKQPNWFFQASSIVLIAILIIVGIWVFKATKRYAESVDKENRLVTLLSERNDFLNEKESLLAITNQLNVVLENGTSFIKDLNHYQPPDSVHIHIQTIIESMATDIKTVIGEKHRCGFWLADDDNSILKFVNGSASFSGFAKQRLLKINHSIAGRCYRKNSSLHINDVSLDPDWSISDNPGSFTSLICVPVLNWGVITIDAKQKMTDNTVLIGEFYASIIEGFLNKYTLGQINNVFFEEVAPDNESTQEEGDEDNGQS
ncbi:GAF domain-containing protein [Peribacillus frigoritolerans]|uniref:GAF domain-containing protein n=1 Tax=Peribacillus frigoritolerans TaxID=450367 RepID=UPI0020BFFFFD|nr:GAF domain-containing protein [Peribacillus frigoritolerans]MEE3951667.1 GAF domain-containing protein [Peribacillus frigoritolerans]